MKAEAVSMDFYGREKISKILLKTAPPVMLAQLIQALYNLVDSFFVGQYSPEGLTALSVIYPMQLIIIALAVGTGVGVNTYMARKFAQESERSADDAAGTGMILALVTWAVFAVLAALFMRPYVMTSARDPQAVEDAVVYGNIVCIGSIGVFLEGCWTKVHQAQGNMRLPMAAQIAGAAVNLIFDPILIFGAGMGVAGAAYATVLGQIAAAVITGVRGVRRPPKLQNIRHYVKRIYYFGYASILMQALYTVYIVALNMILAGFSDEAVTVLGLYYKLQTFFFIPLMGLQTCIVPLLSYNYAAAKYDRCKETMRLSFGISAAVMALGTASFVFLPRALISIFSHSEKVLMIGAVAFPVIGLSFVQAVFSLMTPVFFQDIGRGKESLFLSLLRQIFCLIPIFWGLSLLGLNYTWWAFPISEIIVGTVGYGLYRREMRKAAE